MSMKRKNGSVHSPRDLANAWMQPVDCQVRQPEGREPIPRTKSPVPQLPGWNMWLSRLTKGLIHWKRGMVRRGAGPLLETIMTWNWLNCKVFQS